MTDPVAAGPALTPDDSPATPVAGGPAPRTRDYVRGIVTVLVVLVLLVAAAWALVTLFGGCDCTTRPASSLLR